MTPHESPSFTPSLVFRCQIFFLFCQSLCQVCSSSFIWFIFCFVLHIIYFLWHLFTILHFSPRRSCFIITFLNCSLYNFPPYSSLRFPLMSLILHILYTWYGSSNFLLSLHQLSFVVSFLPFLWVIISFFFRFSIFGLVPFAMHHQSYFLTGMAPHNPSFTLTCLSLLVFILSY